MLSRTEILIENLREALRQGQRFIFLSAFASLLWFLFELDPAGKVQLPGGLPPIRLLLAEGILWGVSIATMFQAWIMLSRAGRLADDLKDTPDMREAALSYPSVPTTNAPIPRILVVLVPLALMSAALWMWASRVGDLFGAGLGQVFTTVPYVFVLMEMWNPVGGPAKVQSSE